MSRCDTSTAAVAAIDSSTDVIGLLQHALEQASFPRRHPYIDDIRTGRLDLARYVEQHDPYVIVYDIVPPYDRNWRFLAELRDPPIFNGRPFVVTSTDAQRVQQAVGGDTDVYEMVGTPYDPEFIVDTVKEASRRTVVTIRPH